ncbi:MAG: arsenite S-adenosylmethyltransferase, partial [Bacteroidota bacterium]
QMDEYLGLIKEAGFENISVQKQKPILLPDDVLLEYLTPEMLQAFTASKTGILSITVYAEKPGGAPREKFVDILGTKSEGKTCCGPECCN